MKKNISIIIGVIIIILGIILLTGGSKDTSVDLTETETETQFMERISVQHSYDNGKHSIYGVITAPTPCHKVEVSSTNRDGDVLIDINLVEGEGICTQVMTNLPFLYSFEAEEDATLVATYNGEEALLNIMELEEGEDFDLADFMFKG